MNNPGSNDIASLAQRLEALEQRGDQHTRELGQLNMWHQGHLFAYIARLYPKNRSVIFLRGDYFGDNTKYAFLNFLPIAQKQGITCHFLTSNNAVREQLTQNGLPVLPAVSSWTIEHLRLLMSAKVLVTCDHFSPFMWDPPLPYFLLQGARLIQLWHGIPFKEIGLLYGDGAAQVFESVRLTTTGPADVFVAPGNAMREQWRQWFAFRNFAPIGYPRNDVLTREPMMEELINVDTNAFKDMKTARSDNRKTIFYAPTFRDRVGTQWLERANLSALTAWCKQKGHELYLKLHPADQGYFESAQKSLPGLRFVRPDSDAYPLLRHADVLVTDYSSIAFDFMLLNRPTVFYWPDDADYRSQCRALLPGAENCMAGDRATNVDGLCQALEKALAGGQDSWMPRREALAQILYDQQDGMAGDRVTRLILEELDKDEELPPGWGI